MKRRDLVAGAITAAAAWASVGAGLPCGRGGAHAQSGPRTWRLGLLSSGTAQGLASVLRLALPELATRGFAAGRNLAIERRHAEGEAERLPDLARELAETRPDVILAASAPAVRAAMEAAPAIPVAMALIREDPVAEGLVASFERPGGRVTGVVLAAEADARRIELLAEAFPGVTRVSLISSKQPEDLSEPSHRAAAALGLDIVAYRADGPRDYDLVFQYAAAGGSAAFLLNTGPSLFPDAAEVARRAAARRSPAVGAWQETARAGCVLAYGPSFEMACRDIGTVVARLLEGADPAELPVEQPRMALAINSKVAKALDLTIAPVLLTRADEVIE
jgi:putative tryptophan/tyrosine transport system substrate-binding protein